MSTITLPGALATAARRFSEIDFDRELGIPAERIAADQGRTMRTLERYAARHGRPDLAAFFHTTRKPTNRRTGTCSTCGGTCHKDAQRCVSCWTRWVRGDAA